VTDDPNDPRSSPERLDLIFDLLDLEASWLDRGSRDRRAPVPPRPRQSGVEWGVAWDDGRVTNVDSEAAARFVADRHGACQVTCRLVGPWGPA